MGLSVRKLGAGEPKKPFVGALCCRTATWARLRTASSWRAFASPCHIAS
jgi:hypothetical protein